jgi:hypothetical protein
MFRAACTIVVALALLLPGPAFPEAWNPPANPDFQFTGLIGQAAPADAWTVDDFSPDKPKSIQGDDIVFPNNADPNKFKRVWASFQSAGGGQVFPTLKVGGTIIPPKYNPPYGGDWTYIMWEIRPQPAEETITVPNINSVAEIIVSTECLVPEPSGVLALLGGMGALVGLVRRRR